MVEFQPPPRAPALRAWSVRLILCCVGAAVLAWLLALTDQEHRLGTRTRVYWHRDLAGELQGFVSLVKVRSRGRVEVAALEVSLLSPLDRDAPRIVSVRTDRALLPWPRFASFAVVGGPGGERERRLDPARPWLLGVWDSGHAVVDASHLSQAHLAALEAVLQNPLYRDRSLEAYAAAGWVLPGLPLSRPRQNAGP